MRNVLCPCSWFDSMAVIPGDSGRPRRKGRSQQIRTLRTSSHPDLEPFSLLSFARPVSFLYLKCWGSSVYGFCCHCPYIASSLFLVCCVTFAHSFKPPIWHLCPDFPQTPPIGPVCIPLFLSTLSGIFTHKMPRQKSGYLTWLFLAFHRLTSSQWLSPLYLSSRCSSLSPYLLRWLK